MPTITTSRDKPVVIARQRIPPTFMPEETGHNVNR